MSRTESSGMVLEACWELFRHDIQMKMRGFSVVYNNVRKQRAIGTNTDSSILPVVCDAVATAACFYWKPILCMQRSVVTTRMLRRRGVDARLVFGYRREPFLAHAWVEVDGRVVNDSPAYKERLTLLSEI